MFIKPRKEISDIRELLALFPVVAILGPRQCGKTTLAKQFSYDSYFDLENPRDVARLDNPQIALENLQGLIVIDEIQRAQDIFPLLRYLVDNKEKQRYLILGSASPNLVKQSSESLAGRIGYYNLWGVGIQDVDQENINSLGKALLLSALAKSSKQALKVSISGKPIKALRLIFSGKNPGKTGGSSSNMPMHPRRQNRCK